MAKKKATTILATSRAMAKPPRLTWDKAIADTKERIVAAQRYITGLEDSIRTFQEMKNTGEPFPGEKALLGQDSDL